MHKISVIIPAYNHEAFIHAAIDSVLEQDFENFELVIVDDCSSDNTWQIIQGYPDKRVRAFRNHQNLGAHATLNRGVQLSGGSVLAFLNSDDVYLPGRLSTAERYFADDPSLGGVFTLYECIDAGSNITVQGAEIEQEIARYQPSIEELPAKDAFLLQLVAKNFLHTTSNLLCRREAFENTGGFRPFRYVHDHDFFLRLCSRYRTLFLHDVLLQYRRHEKNTISENYLSSVIETTSMLVHFLRTSNFLKQSFPEKTSRKIFSYLLRFMNWYGGERLGLLLAIFPHVECLEGEITTEKIPVMASDMQLIRETMKKFVFDENQRNDMQWQKNQTEKWWRECMHYKQQAESLFFQLGHLKADKKWQEEQSGKWWRECMQYKQQADRLEADKKWQEEQSDKWWRECMQYKQQAEELEQERMRLLEYIDRKRLLGIARLCKRIKHLVSPSMPNDHHK